MNFLFSKVKCWLLLLPGMLFACSAQSVKKESISLIEGSPAVFAVEESYQIFLRIRKPALVKIKVGRSVFSGHTNGVRPSGSKVHAFTVPGKLLDKVGLYEVICQELPERRPYMREVKRFPEKSFMYEFKALPAENVRIFHIADIHNRITQATATAAAAGKFDLLILNGDLVEHMASPSSLETALVLAGNMTGGRLPVICTRGNHELRGKFAENITQYMPNHQGKLYYQVKCGPLYAVVLDGGEDKSDSHPAYGNTIDCTSFREEQLEYLRSSALREEFKVAQSKYKLVICHIPFPRYMGKSTADEEKRLFTVYGEWSKELKTFLKPHLIVSGHVHRKLIQHGPDFPAPVLMGAALDKKTDIVSGSMLTLAKGKIHVDFIDHLGKKGSGERISNP